MGEGDAEVEAPAFMPGEDVHFFPKTLQDIVHRDMLGVKMG